MSLAEIFRKGFYMKLWFRGYFRLSTLPLTYLIQKVKRFPSIEKGFYVK